MKEVWELMKKYKWRTALSLAPWVAIALIIILNVWG